MRKTASKVIQVLLFSVLTLLARSLPAAGGKSTESEKTSWDMYLNLKKTSRDSSIGLNWRLRWDFSDIKSIPGSLLSFRGMRKWDITEKTKLSMYGFSINPWKLILKKEKMKTAPGKGGNAREGGKRAPVYRKKFAFSLYPLYRDLTAPEKIREILIEGSLSTLPGWKKADKKAKKAFIEDILSINKIWDAPALREMRKEGEEYLEEEFRDKKKKTFRINDRR